MDTRHLPSARPFDPADPRPHWARMTPDGGPTWPDDAAIFRWRAAAFSKGKRFVEEPEDGQMTAVGLFGGGE